MSYGGKKDDLQTNQKVPCLSLPLSLSLAAADALSAQQATKVRIKSLLPKLSGQESSGVSKYY